MSIDNAMDRLRAANPAPDTRLLRAEFDDLNVRLSATWQRSTNVQTQQPQETQQAEKSSHRGWFVAAAAFAVVIVVGLTAVLVSNGSADGEAAGLVAGPVVIVAQVDFDERPIIGTFEVTDGADALQCSSGTFEDGRLDNPTHLRVFTCESGPRQGTFTATFTVNFPTTAPNLGDGSWSFAEGSDDFAGLQGSGEWSEIGVEDAPQSVDTWIGEFNYAP